MRWWRWRRDVNERLDDVNERLGNHRRRLERIESRYAERISDLEVRLDNLRREQMGEKNEKEQEFTTFGLSQGAKVEVVRESDGKFLTSEGFLSVEAAYEAAHEVAIKYPTESFLIYAPVERVFADTPVQRELLNDFGKKEKK